MCKEIIDIGLFYYQIIKNKDARRFNFYASFKVRRFRFKTRNIFLSFEFCV